MDEQQQQIHQVTAMPAASQTMANTTAQQDITPPTVDINEIIPTAPAASTIPDKITANTQTLQPPASTTPVQPATEVISEAPIVSNSEVSAVPATGSMFGQNPVTPQDARDHIATAPQAGEGELLAKDKNPSNPKNKILIYVLGAMILAAAVVIFVLITA